MDNSPYFDQPEVWSESAHEYQVQVGKDVAQLVPRDVAEILDVGCGNGLITKALTGSYTVTGVDQSLVALAESTASVVQADAGKLPFANASFDLVLTTDMLEHVSALEAVIAELVRVSRRYVLITVPFAEDLASKLAVCANCGSRFHINHHLRSFDVLAVRQMEALIGPLVEMRLSGGVGKPPPDELAHVRHQADCYLDWEGSKCPRCGSPGSAGSGGVMKRSMLDSLRGQAWAERLRQQGLCEDRSEIMCLFAVDDSFSKAVDPAPCRELESVGKKNLCLVEFTPGEAGQEFVAGAQYARQRLLPNPTDSAQQIHQVSFPIPLACDDQVLLRLRRPGKVRVYAIHGVLGDKIELLPQNDESDLARAFLVPDDIPCSVFGGLVELVVERSGILMDCELKSPSAEELKAEFVKLAVGANLVQLDAGLPRFSWSLSCEAEANCPDPVPTLQELRDRYLGDEVSEPSVGSFASSGIDRLLPMLRVIESLADRVAEISGIANKLESQRSELEDMITLRDKENAAAIADVQRWAAQVEGMSDAANKIEAQRSALDAQLLESREEIEQHKRELQIIQGRYVEAQRKLESMSSELASRDEADDKQREVANALEAKRADLEDIIQAKDEALIELEKSYNELLATTRSD